MFFYVFVHTCENSIGTVVDLLQFMREMLSHTVKNGGISVPSLESVADHSEVIPDGLY